MYLGIERDVVVVHHATNLQFGASNKMICRKSTLPGYNQPIIDCNSIEAKQSSIDHGKIGH